MPIWLVVSWCVVLVLDLALVVHSWLQRRAGRPLSVLQVLQPLAIPVMLGAGLLGPLWFLAAVLVLLGLAVAEAIRSGHFRSGWTATEEE